MKYTAGKVCLLVMLFCLFSIQTFAAEYDFVVVQPGEPGSTSDAQPVMDSLSQYLSVKTGEKVSGKYFNELEPAISWIKKNNPAWGIVDYTFYKIYGKRFSLSPIAATRPSGLDSDVWRLIVPADGPDTADKLSGAVYGTMFYNPKAAEILFSPDAVPQNFKAEGTTTVLRWFRRTARGRADGVCLNSVQFSVAENLPSFSKLKVIHTSAELPNSPVVSFGKKDLKKITDVLMKMKDDPQASDLLTLLRTQGFDSADKRLQ